MSDQDKAAIRRIPLEVFNEGRLEVVDQVVAEGYVEHVPLPPGLPTGRTGLKGFVSGIRSAFPDFKYTLVHELGEGELVVQHLTASGTMTGDFPGMPPMRAVFSDPDCAAADPVSRGV
jgi:predicted SnoaL-like aldol condensation-catalyzing enzyme